MQRFRHVSEGFRLFHGADGIGWLGAELDRLKAGRAAVICSGSIQRNPVLMEALQAALGDRLAGVFAGAKPHSPLDSVQAAAEELRRVKADAVVAVGGGSAIVTARAAAILLAENSPARELATRRGPDGRLFSPRLNEPKLPQMVVPTTPTTAIVKAGSAIQDTETKQRLAMFDPKTRAVSVFVDERFVMSAPQNLVVSAAIDSLVLALEGLISARRDPITDAMLMHAARLMRHNLLAGAGDVNLRSALMMSAILAGRGSDNAGAGVATSLGHAVTKFTDVENGIIKLMLLPHAVRFSAQASGDGVTNMANAIADQAGNDPIVAVLEELDRLMGEFDLPQRLRDCGVKQEHFPEIAASTMDDWWLKDSARPVKEAGELEAILQQAW